MLSSGDILLRFACPAFAERATRCPAACTLCLQCRHLPRAAPSPPHIWGVSPPKHRQDVRAGRRWCSEEASEPGKHWG